MDNAREAWVDHLALVGEDEYVSATGSHSVPADVLQLLRCVAVMIEENNNAHS